MGNATPLDIALGVGYVSAALFLIIVAYQIYLKRYKRNKLEALSAVQLITSKENVFSNKTSFLIVSAHGKHVKIELLDEKEKVVDTLIDEEVISDEYPLDFDPTKYSSGKYYLYLTTDSAQILRGITIAV